MINHPVPGSVAVCIPTFNQAPYLRLAVESACEQDWADLEVWVADDASTDETPELMASLCRQHANLHYHRRAVNGGIAVNNTELLAKPQTEFIVRLDSDDLLLPGYVPALAEALGRHPEAGYAHTAVREIDKSGAETRIRRVARAGVEYQDADTALKASVAGYRTAANILMFRAKALRELDYYEGRPEFVEDYDLSVRMADAGYGNVYVDEVLASYRVWSDAANKRAKRKNLQLRGYRRIFEESMVPAFRKRGWDTAPIDQQRIRLAKENVSYCFQPLFSAEEREELLTLLLALGDSPGVRARIRACSLGLGFWFDLQTHLYYGAKKAAKAVLARLRSGRQARA